MSDTRGHELSNLLAQSGVGWIVEDHPNAERVLERMEEAAREYGRRFRTQVDLLAACKMMPEKMRAFLQTLAAGVSPSLLAMVARIVLREARVTGVRFEVASGRSSSLHVEIEDPDGGVQSFDSSEIWDAEVLRHFGLMRIGDTPLISGYYAAKVP